MTFLWPNLLWALILVPLFVLLYLFLLRRRKRNAVRYASLAMVKEAMGKGAGFKRHIPPLLLLVAFAVMVVAMARPAAYVTLPSERGTIMLAIDVSGSMRASDIKPTRIEAAQEAAMTFVKEQPHNVRIGVVAFSGFASVVQSPTLNRDEVTAAIERLRPQRATAVGSGILVSLSAIFPDLEFNLGPQRPYGSPGFGGRPRFGGGFGGSGGFGAQPGNTGPGGDRSGAVPLGESSKQKQQLPPPVPPGSDKSAAIVLLTDGQSNTGINPIDAAQTAADLGIRIYTVGLGTKDGQILGFSGWRAHVRLDEDTLKKIASLTLGKYFRASSDTDLKEIYRGLSTRLMTERQKSEISALFIAGAAGVMLVAAFLSLLWFGRLT